MSLRKAYALVAVACLVLMLVPFQAFAANAVPKLMLTEIIPNGKNVVNPATGKNYTEAYEMMEITNTSNQPIPVKDFKIFFGAAGAEVELPWLDGTESKVIPAGGSLVVWPRQTNNPFTVEDFYNYNLTLNPDLKMDQIAIVQGPQMHNTADRQGWIAAADGTIICNFLYNGVSTETIDAMSIRYSYPTDGSINLVKIAFGTTPTPGVTDKDQIGK